MYQIRTYTPDDRAQVAGLFHRLWSIDPQQNENYLAWRYEQNPYIKNSLAVAESAGRIVAVRGGYGMKWRIGGTTELIPCLGDTIVAREHEGRRLVQKLSAHLFTELAGHGARYVVNQSPGKLVEKISLRTGWRRVAHRKLTKYLDPDAEELGFQHLDASTAEADSDNDHRIIIRQAPPDNLLALLEQRRSTPPIAHNVDDQYIQWRFNNPFAEYRWVCAYRHEELTGFLLIARTAVARMTNRYRILDLWGLDPAIQAALLRHTLDHGRFNNLLLWWNRFPRLIVGLLLEYGFAATSREMRNPTILIRNILPDLDYKISNTDLLNIANWDARMIHSDVT